MAGYLDVRNVNLTFPSPNSSVQYRLQVLNDLYAFKLCHYCSVIKKKQSVRLDYWTETKLLLSL